MEQLCASVSDIHLLAKQIGVLYATYVVQSHLKTLAIYEQQVKENIIDKLPDDEPMTIRSGTKLIDSNYENFKEQLDTKTTKTKTCILEAQIGEVNYQECKATVDSEYQTAMQDNDLRKAKQENALKYFEQNYRKDP